MPALVECSPARALAAVEGAQLWCADLNQPAHVIGQMTSMLSVSERERTAALRGAPARRRFVVGRATLRVILGRMTGVAPEQVQFLYGRDGKPTLGVADLSAAPYFNVSHSRDLAIFAVAGHRQVGVDVEWTEGSAPIESVARRYFSHAERTLLDAAPDDQRRRLFFRIWVRKEAYLKGRGEGISHWIHETDFSTLDNGSDAAPGAPARDQDNWTARDQDNWTVRDISGLPTGHVASIALARSGW